MKKDRLFFLLTIFFSFIIYFFSSSKGVYTGDSGEIATAVAVWGIAHPTGFPLYIILGKLFSYLLPMVEFAYRLNIFAGLTSALTVGVVYLILRKLNISQVISIISVLSLSVGFSFWSHATVLQVYSLTALFFSLAIYVLLVWLDSQNNKLFYLLALICGLGIGTHLTFLLSIPFILIYVFIYNKKLFTFKKVAIFSIILLFFVGILYLYIPLRSMQNPLLNWGNPSNITSFIDYITQKDYADKIANRTSNSWGVMLAETLRLFNREFTALGLLFGIIGLFFTKKNHRPFFYAGIFTIIFNILLLGNYGNEGDIFILWRYFLPSYIILICFIAFALEKIFINKKYAYYAFLFTIIIFIFNVKEHNRKNINITDDFLNNVFLSLPNDSVLISGGDTFFGGFFYKQSVLNQRKDLIIIDYLMNTHPWYLEKKQTELINKNYIYKQDLVELIKQNPDKQFFSLVNSESFLINNFNLYPNGLVYEIKNKDEVVDPQFIKNKNEELWQSYYLESIYNKSFDNDYFINEIIKIYIADLDNLAAYIFNNGYYDDGISYFKKSLDIRQNQNALYNLYYIYSELGDKKKTLEYKSLLDNL